MGKKKKHKGDGEIRQEAGCSVKYSSEKNLKKKATSEQRLKREESEGDGYLSSGRAIQAERMMVCAKSLRQEHAGCVQGIARRPVRLEEGQQGGEQCDRSMVERGHGVFRPL